MEGSYKNVSRITAFLGGIFGTVGLFVLLKPTEVVILNRLEKYHKLIFRWLNRTESDLSIDEILQKRGISSIAIYGAGEMGMRFYEELRNKNTQTLYVIDSRDGFLDGIPVVPLKNIASQPKIDAVVITPIYDSKRIKRSIRKKTKTLILSLDEIV